MGEIHFRADRLFAWDLGIERSHKKHIIPMHHLGVPGSYPPYAICFRLRNPCFSRILPGISIEGGRA
jgi:hypothetical protein